MASSINTSYLVLAGVVVVSSALIFAVLQPLLGDIQSLQAEIESRQHSLAEREAFLRTLDQKIATLAREAQHEQQLNVVLPVAGEEEDVLRVIHQAATASGGTVRRVNNISAGIQNSINSRRARGEGVSVPATVAALGVELDFASSYQQLRVFLTELQRSPRLLDIPNLEIQRNTQAPDSVASTMTIQFYRYAEPKT